jgi:hypothetical protein
VERQKYDGATAAHPPPLLSDVAKPASCPKRHGWIQRGRGRTVRVIYWHCRLGVFGHQNDIQLITVASQALHMSQLSGGSVKGIGVGEIKSQYYLGLESHLDQIRKLVVSEG